MSELFDDIARLMRELERMDDLLKKVIEESKKYGNISIYTIMDIEQALERSED